MLSSLAQLLTVTSFKETLLRSSGIAGTLLRLASKLICFGQFIFRDGRGKSLAALGSLSASQIIFGLGIAVKRVTCRFFNLGGSSVACDLAVK